MTGTTGVLLLVPGVQARVLGQPQEQPRVLGEPGDALRLLLQQLERRERGGRVGRRQADAVDEAGRRVLEVLDDLACGRRCNRRSCRSDLLSVPIHRSTSRGLMPKCSLMPRPCRPIVPIEWASSTIR